MYGLLAAADGKFWRGKGSTEGNSGGVFADEVCMIHVLDHCWYD